MAKHLIAAQNEGVEAGFDLFIEYLNSPLGSANPHMEDAIEAVNGQARAVALGWYCDNFNLEVPTPVKRGPGRPKGSKNKKGAGKAAATAAVEAATITGEQAWQALGGGKKFKPNAERLAAPASNGMLYLLNTRGLLQFS